VEQACGIGVPRRGQSSPNDSRPRRSRRPPRKPLYRAGLSVDRLHDEADRVAGRRVACPTLILWSKHDDLERLYGDVLAVWRPWLSELQGHSLDSGHHMAEEVPEELASQLLPFLR
jgi:haloacetate dehalogenase